MMLEEEVLRIAETIISKSYISQGRQSFRQRVKLAKSLLSERRLPETGWDDDSIECFIQECATMDSNNFLHGVGVGEREARVASDLVRRRHWGLAHGIGRSGDLTAQQPKAAGSSLLAKLTNFLALDALKEAGLSDVGAATVLPLATGMAITVTLLALRGRRPSGARYVIWPRADQQTCAKSILSAGLELLTVPLILEGDELRTDVDAISELIQSHGPDSIVCVVTTSSCFAPRAPDRVADVARVCQEAGVGHVINNAYGLQDPDTCEEISRAWRRGRVDAVVQSTDKNFMVPVGGSIIAAPKKDTATVEDVNRLYPGRACMAPLMDLFITLLHWGREGWARVRQERRETFVYLRDRLEDCAARNGERLLITPGNPISLAITLDTLKPRGAAAPAAQPAQPEAAQVQAAAEAAAAAANRAAGRTGNESFFGSMLFSRFVSGTRVVTAGTVKKIGPHRFESYGAHCDAYPHVYLTAAAALGTTRADVDSFVNRLDAAFVEFQQKDRAEAAASAALAAAAAGAGEAPSALAPGPVGVTVSAAAVAIASQAAAPPVIVTLPLPPSSSAGNLANQSPAPSLGSRSGGSVREGSVRDPQESGGRGDRRDRGDRDRLSHDGTPTPPSHMRHGPYPSHAPAPVTANGVGITASGVPHSYNSAAQHTHTYPQAGTGPDSGPSTGSGGGGRGGGRSLPRRNSGFNARGGGGGGGGGGGFSGQPYSPPPYQNSPGAGAGGEYRGGGSQQWVSVPAGGVPWQGHNSQGQYSQGQGQGLAQLQAPYSDARQRRQSADRPGGAPPERGAGGGSGPRGQYSGGGGRGPPQHQQLNSPGGGGGGRGGPQHQGSPGPAQGGPRQGPQPPQPPPGPPMMMGGAVPVVAYPYHPPGGGSWGYMAPAGPQGPMYATAPQPMYQGVRQGVAMGPQQGGYMYGPPPGHDGPAPPPQQQMQPQYGQWQGQGQMPQMQGGGGGVGGMGGAGRGAGGRGRGRGLGHFHPGGQSPTVGGVGIPPIRTTSGAGSDTGGGGGWQGQRPPRSPDVGSSGGGGGGGGSDAEPGSGAGRRGTGDGDE